MQYIGVSEINMFYFRKPDCMQFYVDKDVNFDLLAYSNSYLPLHTDHAYSISHPLVRYLSLHNQQFMLYVTSTKTLVKIFNQGFCRSNIQNNGNDKNCRLKSQLYYATLCNWSIMMCWLIVIPIH